MRGHHVLAATVLVLGALAGCLGGEEDVPQDDPGGLPRTPESEESRRTFLTLEEQAREQAGGGALVTAFGLAAAQPDDLETVSGNFSSMAEIAASLTAARSRVPGDGDLRAWVFVYEASPDAQSLTYVVAERSGGAEDYALEQGELDRSELVMLRAGGAIEDLPAASPADALNAAMSQGNWSAMTSRSGVFVLYILKADDAGAPEWRMIISEYDPLNGYEVVVDGQNGELEGAVRDWPEPVKKGIQIAGGNQVNVRVPGDQVSFAFNVPVAGHPVAHVYPTKQGGVSQPQTLLISPSGDSQELEFDAIHSWDAPEAGGWTVEYTWDLVDYYRSVRAEYCLQPIPFLFAERVHACDEWE